MTSAFVESREAKREEDNPSTGLNAPLRCFADVRHLSLLLGHRSYSQIYSQIEHGARLLQNDVGRAAVGAEPNVHLVSRESISSPPAVTTHLP